MRNFSFELLTQSAREEIHAASMDILEKLGVRVNHEGVRELLLKNGAREGDMAGVVRLPSELVMSCLKLCPRKVVLADRRGNSKILAPGGEQVYFTSNAYNRLDDDDNLCEITRDSFGDYVRVIDNLENVFGVVGTNLSDVPVASRDVTGFRIMLENTSKHIRPCAYTPQGVDVMLDMAQVILGGRSYEELPFFSLGYTIVSPLLWSYEACEIFLRSSNRKILLMINAEPLAGGTSPVTLAGSIALANAEVLSGIVINQLIEPGRPLIHNIGIAHVLDMKSTISLTGTPENSLMAGAGAEMAAYYNLPCASWMNTDAFAVDGQAMMEKTLTIQTHTMSGVNMIWGVGNMESTMCCSPVMAVIDDEIVGSVGRIMQGITVDEETIALGIVKFGSVGRHKEKGINGNW